MKNLHHFEKEPRDEPKKRDFLDALKMMVRPMNPPPKDENRDPTKAERIERWKLRRQAR